MLKKNRKINIRTLIMACLAVVLVGYIGVSLAFSSTLSATRTCRGIRIIVVDSLSNGFVRGAQLQDDLGELFRSVKGTPLSQLNLKAIEQKLESNARIESAEAVCRTNDSVYVTVHPLVPVARIFDRNGSYYINRSGKRFEADARYTMDVPVVKGNFLDNGLDPLMVLPLVDYIEGDNQWRDIFSMIEVQNANNIFLIPDIRGQVVAFGSIDNIPTKFDHLKRFYHEVLPYKGWNFYDTISVKWQGQIVATRATKKAAADLLVIDDSPQPDTGEEGINFDELKKDNTTKTTQTSENNKNNNKH